VPAPVALVVVHDGRVAVLSPAAWCLDDLAGERAEGDRDVTGAVIPVGFLIDLRTPHRTTRLDDGRTEECSIIN
jgi:hypothetical protein